MSDQSVIDQLDEGIAVLLARASSETSASDPMLSELLAIAEDLRTLPDPDFRARLKADLMDEAAINSPASSEMWRAQGLTTEDTEEHGGVLGRRKPVTPRAKPLKPAALLGRERDMTVPSDILPTLFGAGYGAYPVRRGSFMASLAAHAAAIAILVGSGVWMAQHREKIPLVTVTLLAEPSPYILPAARDQAGGGGGGGDRDVLQASKGNPPRFAREQITPPEIVVRNEAPKLEAEPTVVGPPSLSFPQASQMGDPLSGILAPPSNGTGFGGGIGSSSGGGVGSGHGPGVGPGFGGGIGGGVYHVGGGVSAPRAVWDPEPEYSEEARKAKYQGVVMLQIIVGADGRPKDVRVARSLGFGLDERAIEAVRQWRFEPATKDGQPVAVLVNVEVNFRLY